MQQNRVVVPLIILILIWTASVFTGGREASAHSTGETYIFLGERGGLLQGRIEVRISDLIDKLGLSLPERPTAADVERVVPSVDAYVDEHFQISSDGRNLPIRITGADLLNVPQGSYAQFSFVAEGEYGRQLDFRYRLFFENDSMHRGLLLWEGETVTEELLEEDTALIFGPNSVQQRLDLDNIPSLPRVRTFVVQGAWHIWIGLDHVLFIIVLILPAVMRLRLHGDVNGWQPVEGFSAALWNLLKVITVFTVAHSATLALAGLDLVSLPSRLVESLIAASIIVMAVLNIWPRFNHHGLWLVFIFGLVHGLGFASVMGELPFRTAVTSHLLAVVLAFNVGVELGQIAIVMILFPLLYLARRWTAYTPAVIRLGSALCALVALPWLVERSFDIDLGLSFI